MKSISMSVVLAIASMNLYATDYDFVPGLYEEESMMELSGVPGKVPMEKEQHCVTEFKFESDDECTYDVTRVNKNKMLFASTCTDADGEAMNLNAEYNFNGKVITGWMGGVITKGVNKPMDMKRTFKWTYIGECEG